MDVRGQEAAERSSNNNHNGTSPVPCTQGLDHVHQRRHHAAKSSPSRALGVRYRECLKNHAASVGGTVYDGCGEFMPSGEEGSIEALKCAACDCHRNFHRKEVEGESSLHYGAISAGRRAMNMMLNPLQLPPPPHHHHHHPHHQKYAFHASPTSAMVTPMSVAFAGGGGGGGGTESSSEDLNLYGGQSSGGGGGEHGVVVQQPAPPPFSMSSRKRFRTKFTQEQKDRMMEFAERLGWRMNKQDEEELERFCAEIGVKRQVFKVWMHNNKSNVVKKQQEQPQQPV